jgi:hypothetical protein
VPEQLRARLVPVGGVRPAAAIAGADDGILRAEDVLLRLRIVVAVDRLEAGLQVLSRATVEEPDRLDHKRQASWLRANFVALFRNETEHHA